MTPINITLTADSVVVPNGMGGTKRISIQDFLQELNQAVTSQEESSSNSRGIQAFIPPSSLCAMYESGNHRKRTLVMYYPSIRSDILHTDSEHRAANGERGYQSCIIPNIVIVLGVDFNPTNEHGHRWTLSYTTFLCTEMPRAEVAALGRVPALSVSGFYSLPFNNQYDNGSMCTGGNVLQSVFYNDFTVADAIYYTTLLGSPFNNDLGLRGVAVSCDSNKSWYRYLQYCNQFPYWYIRNTRVRNMPEGCDDISWDTWRGLAASERNKLIKERIAARS